jgi:hypothetical protein
VKQIRPERAARRDVAPRRPRRPGRRASRGRMPSEAACVPQDAPRPKRLGVSPRHTPARRSRVAPSSGLSAVSPPLCDIPRPHLRRPYVTKGRSRLFKGRPPPRARHASVVRHGCHLSKLPYLLTFLAVAHANLYLGADRTSPCHALLWLRRRLAGCKTAAAAGTEDHRTHAPAPCPPQLQSKMSPR